MGDVKKFTCSKSILLEDLTRICEFFSKPTNETEALVKYQRLLSLESEVKQLISDIIKYNSTAEKENEVSLKDRSKFFELIDTSKAAYFRYSDKQKSKEISQNSVSSTPSSRPVLPTLQIPKFDGTIEHWLEFKSLFDSLIHSNSDLSNEQKLNYLKSTVRGEAAASISAFPVDPGTYELAYKTLVNRYENPRRLGNYYLQMILKFRKNQSFHPQNFLNVHQAAINALKNLKIPDLSEFLLFQLAYNNLDTEIQQAFDLKLGDISVVPKSDQLIEYIQVIAKTDELKKDVQIKHQSVTKAHVSQIHQKKNAQKNCTLCKKNHFLAYCEQFQSKSLAEKLEFIYKHQLCKNCLGFHKLQECFSSKRCKFCQQNHHSLIHESASKITSNHSLREDKSVMLATATILIQSKGEYHSARALIDQGSEASFVAESLVQRLNLKREYSCSFVSGIGGNSSSKTKGSVLLQFKSRHNTGNLSTKALILPKLTDYLPPRINVTKLEWENLVLADEDLSAHTKIEIILGVDIYPEIIRQGVQKSSDNLLLAQNTSLGWIISGAVPEDSSSKQQNKTSESSSVLNLHCCTINQELLEAVQKFWSIEEPSSKIQDTVENKECEEHFRSNTQLKNDRITVRLPFKDHPSKLGDSLGAAKRIYSHLQKRLQKDSELSRLYCEFMDEYEKMNHMELVSPEVLQQPHYFLPHHAVLRPSSSTTKLRVVFNASKKTTTNLSLNDILHIGPQLLPNLQDMVLRWRKHKIVFSADIEKMYRQIMVHEEDRKYQLILWNRNTDEEPNIYQLNTVTYGTACAPYLAIRSLRKLAEEDSDFPLAHKIIQEDTYMDDVLSGANEIEEALELQRQLMALFRKGSFNLRKWTSNARELITHLPENLRETNTENSIFPSETFTMLGLKWNAGTDTIILRSKDVKSLPTIISKRTVLSEVAKLFDPLGYATPVVIRAKIYLQSLWQTKLSWDDPLPAELNKEWINIHTDLSKINIKIPRWLGYSSNAEEIELHGFSDASEKAMAAVVYIRIKCGEIINVKLLGSRSKVAPIKQVSLPRLELNAAWHLSQLTKKFREALDLKFEKRIKVYQWTDSMITLNWIRGQPRQWETYVGNRVSQIQTIDADANWVYVSSQHNPADCATRGVVTETLNSGEIRNWWTGPEWLTLNKDRWPQQPYIKITNPPGKRKIKEIHVNQVTILSNLIYKVSKFWKLVRIYAFCLRFIQKLRKISSENGPLTATELFSAKLQLIKEVQQSAFSNEIEFLEKKAPINKDSSLAKLSPFLDSSGVLRVGGRLVHSNLTYNMKHPIILPYKHHFTELLIQEVHKATLHGGTQLTLGSIRRQYWIIKGRQAVKSIIKNCIVCKKFQNSSLYQKMANLPKERVTPSRPFLHTGVDYAGPISMRTSKGRGQKSYKGYIAVFVCFFSRAVHLEAVSDYTAEGFLAAYRRFTSRRGICETLTSDRGTNFIGASSEIRNLLKGESANTISNYLSTTNTTWRFNPPCAPHFGGLWEAAVKSTKYHLKRVIGESTLTYEEMSTLLCQIEAVLNSRPLQPLSDDCNDLEALTPGHFLVGVPLQAIPEESTENTPISSLNRWKLIQAQKQHFWKRWSAEYIQQLQARNKWKFPTQTIDEGDLVLIKNETTSPCKWPLARVVQLHKGPDGLARVATLKTATGIFQRPLVKLCPLLHIKENINQN